MSMDECRPALARDDVPGVLVSAAMLKRPKTLPATATVGDVRAFFDNPHMKTVLLVDGQEFVAAIESDDLPAGVDAEIPARTIARPETETVAPDDPLADAIVRLDEIRGNRLVVLDRDGRTLRGLLCLTRDRAGFCSGTV